VGEFGEVRSELETKVTELTAARADLQKKFDQLGSAKDHLQLRVNELVKSRDDLQAMVENLVDTRGMLEKKVAALDSARNAALVDARAAQAKIGQLNDRLTTQTRQMVELQEQVVAIRSVLQQLQQKLE